MKCTETALKIDNRDGGNNDINDVSYITIYPNPTKSDNIQIVQDGNKYLRLYNSLGAIVKEIPTVSREINISISALPAGVYILKSDKDATKLIVQ